MARPNKQGVDYFPLDVHLDDKFKFIEIKYKLEGFAILIKLLQRIYALGYWSKWTEDEMLLFSDEIRADPDLVEKVVNECLKRDIFSQEMFDKHSILTSKGIQKRYKEIVRRRKDVETTEEYLLIDGNFGVNDVINPTSSKQNDSKSTQSKVKESKVNKTKEKEKNKHLDYVYLSADEYNKLVNEFGKATIDSKIEDLDNYLGSTGKFNKYKDHNRTIRAWIKKDGIQSKQRSNQSKKTPEQIEHERMLAEMGIE